MNLDPDSCNVGKYLSLAPSPCPGPPLDTCDPLRLSWRLGAGSPGLTRLHSASTSWPQTTLTSYQGRAECLAENMNRKKMQLC